MDFEGQEELLKRLRLKYPNAETDEFEQYCMTWEFVQGGKGAWFVVCPNGGVNGAGNFSCMDGLQQSLYCVGKVAIQEVSIPEHHTNTAQQRLVARWCNFPGS